MKLQTWILGTEPETKIYTSVSAGRDVAYKKLCFLVPENLRCLMSLKRGRIVDEPERRKT